ncbi:MAG: acyl-CoA thioesterase [Paracoccaceae bacterium]|nr:acyl-CoA thioesterase [Paracoccaceae bacterium]
MYPYLRMGLALARSRRVRGKSIFGTAVTHHRAWPWDTDMYGEINNGRILTLMELGRWGLAVESGLLQAMRQRRAGFAVAGVSVRYRRRVPLFARYRIETRPLGWDARFFYIDQSMWMDEVAANQALIRAAIVSRDGTIPPADIAADLGHDEPSPELPPWVGNWISAETTRPWPPEPL